EQQRAEWRRAVRGVFGESGFEIRDDLHAPSDDFAAAGFEAFPIVAEIIRVVFRTIDLLPGRIHDVPRVDHRERRKNDRLQAADQIFFARRISDFGAPEKSGKSRSDKAANKFAMIVEIAVKDEGIRRGECSTGADEAVGFDFALLVLRENRFLITEAENAVH